MTFVCPKCSYTKYYLQEKGNNTGVYCDKCHSWITWIGKKDIAYFERQAERFLKLVPPINPESITGSTGASENDPVGINSVWPGYLKADATLEEVITKLQELAKHIQEISDDMRVSTQSYRYHSDLFAKKLQELQVQNEEDETPPWD